MHPSLATTLDSLNLPALSKADVSALRDFQHEWQRHSERMLLLLPDRVLNDLKAALEAFLANPTEETEERLAVFADDRLTARRYAVLHDAHAELRRRCNEKAADILRPVLESLQQSLTEELEARETAASAEGLSKRTDARCIELREALERIAHGLRIQAEATSISPVEELSPLGLAEVLLASTEGGRVE